jgi:hypothetical protein
MLDTFIIQRIREEEEERRRRESGRPYLEIPTPPSDRPEMTDDQDGRSSDRGVTIIDPNEE